MKLTYIVRRNENWHKFGKITNVGCDSGIIYNATNLQKEWNSIFNIDYFSFRKMVNEIRIKNQSELNFNEYLNSYELVYPLKGLYFPTDDDDWFHPNVAKTVLENFNNSYNNYRWNIIKYICGKVKCFEEPFNGIYYKWNTNNYSIYNPENIKFLISHDYLDNIQKKSSNEIYINSYLSLHNKNLASISLRLSEEAIGKSWIELYEIYCKEPEIDKLVPDYFYKYIEEMLLLYKNKLRPKKVYY